MAEELIWKVKEVGFKRGNQPRIELSTYPRGSGPLRIKVSAHKFHLSAIGVDLTPKEWVEVVLKVAEAGAKVAGVMIARGLGG